LEGLSSVQVLALADNSFNGMLPTFLRGGFQVSKEITVQGNPFYCPLEPWAIANYSGIHCLHCPGADTTDYTTTCSGHGICIDGQYCRCEQAWNGFSTDCSQLACPSTADASSTDGDSALQFCNGAGECYNTVNSSVTCPTSASETVGMDFVAQSLDCGAGTITIARCRCEVGTIPPQCMAFTATEATNVLVTSPASPHMQRKASALVFAAVATVIQLSWRQH